MPTKPSRGGIKTIDIAARSKDDDALTIAYRSVRLSAGRSKRQSGVAVPFELALKHAGNSSPTRTNAIQIGRRVAAILISVGPTASEQVPEPARYASMIASKSRTGVFDL